MDLHTTLITIIAFSATLTVLSVIFNWLLSPLKENQARLETGLKDTQERLDTGLKENQEQIAQVKDGLRANQEQIAQVKDGLRELKIEIQKAFNNKTGKEI